MKTIKLILLAFLTMSLQCEPEEINECDCDVQFWLSVEGTDINFFNGQEYSYDSNDCSKDGLILEDYNDLGSDGTLYNVKKIVKCELIN